jgi:hypothetical protein
MHSNVVEEDGTKFKREHTRPTFNSKVRVRKGSSVVSISHEQAFGSRRPIRSVRLGLGSVLSDGVRRGNDRQDRYRCDA